MSAWFMLVFWMSASGPSYYWPHHVLSRPAGVQTLRQVYDSKEACLAAIPAIQFNVETKPGETGVVCVEGVIR